VLEKAKKVLKLEANGILELIPKLDNSFVEMVEAIFECKGRLVVTGMGKSGLVGRKIVATLSSTGTPSFFLHPAEAIHGDLGMVGRDDIVLAISNSGETNELNFIIPIFKKTGIKIISFTGNTFSSLAKASDIVINVGVEKEACPLGLAPTTSTTATLAMGDALAVCLIEKRHFSPKDFKRFHPGGTLGQRLNVEVSQVMLVGSHVPSVTPQTLMKDVLEEINCHKLGMTFVLGYKKTLLGIITDGDIRRHLYENGSILGKTAQDVMTAKPKSVTPETLASQAIDIMERYLITCLAVVDDENRLVGVIHLHEILGKGAFSFTTT